jgi:hypothetical protein
MVSAAVLVEVVAEETGEDVETVAELLAELLEAEDPKGVRRPPRRAP